MKTIAFVFALAVALQPTFVQSDDEYPHTFLTVEACKVDLTEAGRSANFITSAFFKVTTDDEGRVQTWSEIGVPKMLPGFVDLDAFKCCVERWSLLPSSQYVISLTCGTTGDALEKWSVGLTQEGHTIKIEIPRTKRGCDETGA